MKYTVAYLLLFLFGPTSLVLGQQTYNACNQALEICPDQTFSVSNIGANATVCPTCEDNFTFCFTPTNSIWLSFSSNTSGGNVSIDFSNLSFETGVGMGSALQAALLQATVPCNPSSYTNLGNCESNQSTNFTINATGLAPNTTYYVVISGANGVSAPAECTFDVQINGSAVDRPVPSVSLSYPSFVCSNAIFQATVSLSNCPNASTFNWYVNGVLRAVTTDSIFQTTDLQNNDVLSVDCACYSTCPTLVNGTSLPIGVSSVSVDAGVDLSITAGDTIQLNGVSAADSILWTPSFFVSNDTILDPFAFPSETTLFTLQVTDALGCVFTDEVLISVLQPFMIPNTFSPNNDGRNDTWVIPGIENYPDCNIFITDRWGQEVYQTSGYSKQTAWKGESRNGKPLTEGVYFYLIDLKDAAKQQFKGSITIIR